MRQYCCNILQTNYAIVILRRLRAAKYNAPRFEVSSSPAVCGASSSKPTKPSSSSVPFAVSTGTPRFGAEPLGEQVQDPLPQVPPVTDAAQLQRALRRRRRLAPCGKAPGHRFNAIPTIRHFWSIFLPFLHHEAHPTPHPLYSLLARSGSCIPLASTRVSAASPGAGRPPRGGEGQQRLGARSCVPVPSHPCPVPSRPVPITLRYLQERRAAGLCARSGRASSWRWGSVRRGAERPGSVRRETEEPGSSRVGGRSCFQTQARSAALKAEAQRGFPCIVT